MGAGITKPFDVLSVGNQLSEPITLNRLRHVCQRESKLPYNVKKHETYRLVNDLNKLGFQIPIIDKRGKEVPIEELCNRVSEVVPSVDKVCMINKQNANNSIEAIKRLIDHFNQNYGSNILMYKNPYGPKSKENMRPIDEVCDDLYMVEDRIRRAISDNKEVVKKKLLDAVGELQTYKTQLDNDFNNYLFKIQHSSQYDQLQSKLVDATKQKEMVLGHINSQYDMLQNQYNQINKTHSDVVDPLLGVATSNLSTYASTPFYPPGFGGNKLMKHFAMNKLFPLTQTALLHDTLTTECNKCVNQFGMTLENYIFQMKTDKENLHKELAFTSGKLMSESPENMNEIKNCYTQLLNPKTAQNCENIIRTKDDREEIKEKYNKQMEQFDCSSKNNQEDCNNSQMCNYDTSDNKCKEKTPDAISKLLFGIGGGNEDDLNDFDGGARQKIKKIAESLQNFEENDDDDNDF